MMQISRILSAIAVFSLDERKLVSITVVFLMKVNAFVRDLMDIQQGFVIPFGGVQVSTRGGPGFEGPLPQ